MPPKAAAKKAVSKPKAAPSSGGGAKKVTSTSAQKKAPAKKTTDKDVTDKLAKLSTSDPPTPTAIEIPFKDLANVLKDEDGKIKGSGKWPLLVDESGRTAVFFKYQGGNFLDVTSPSDVQPEPIRRQLLGSLRYAKYFIVDFGDVDFFDTCMERFDEVQKGLLNDVLDKSIFEKFPYLIRDSDGPDYKENNFLPHVTAEFKFIVLSKIEPHHKIMDTFCVIKIKHE